MAEKYFYSDRVILALTLLFFITNVSFSQDGSMDTTFNIIDQGMTYVEGANDNVTTIAVQDDGKIIIGGDFNFFNGNEVKYITRLNFDGSFDSTFYENIGGGFDWVVEKILIQPDGKILVAGQFTSFNFFGPAYITRLNEDGTKDLGFQPGNPGGFIEAMDIQSDGKILIGGTFGGVKRLNTDGTTDFSFDAMNFDGRIHSINVQSDGKILVGGAYSISQPEYRRDVVRLNIDGTLDPYFETSIMSSNYDGVAVVKNVQDKIFVAGACGDTYGGVSYQHLIKLEMNGTIDTAFWLPNSSLDQNSNTISSILFQNDEKIIVAGRFKKYMNGNKYFKSIMRLNSDGSYDENFFSEKQSNGGVEDIQFQDDNIIIGGSFTSFDDYGKTRVARLLNNTGFSVTDINSYTASDLGMIVSVYPNPASSHLRIISNTVVTDNGFYEIYNLQGSLILSGFLLNNEIDISILKSGVYFLRFKDYFSYCNKRFVKIN